MAFTTVLEKIVDAFFEFINNTKIALYFFLVTTVLIVFEESVSGFIQSDFLHTGVTKSVVRSVFVLSLLWMIILLCFNIYEKVNSKIKNWWNVKELKVQLRSLTSPEKQILSQYLVHDTTSRNFSLVLDGNALALEKKNILIRLTVLAYNDLIVPFNLQPWAYEELKKHPKLLEPELSTLKAQTNEKK